MLVLRVLANNYQFMTDIKVYSGGMVSNPQTATLSILKRLNLYQRVKNDTISHIPVSRLRYIRFKCEFSKKQELIYMGTKILSLSLATLGLAQVII